MANIGASEKRISSAPLFLAVLLVVLVSLEMMSEFRSEIAPTPPDFAAIEDVSARKEAFFNYLRPAIESLNEQRANELADLERIIDELNAGQKQGYWDKRKLRRWAERYELEFHESELLATAEEVWMHLGQIPESMVLAQAAIESGWGTSRFAVQGNNFFGQWCYRKGCGIVPSARADGANHEVRVFDHPQEAVQSYFQNINSHPAYAQVRSIRAETRQAGNSLSGLAMIQGLNRYSQRGQAYVDELRSVIRFNHLE